MNTSFAHSVRLLVCGHCGAPGKVPIEGGQVACAYCSSITVVTPRRADRELARLDRDAPVPAAPDGRLARLRAQVGDPTRDGLDRHLVHYPDLAAMTATDALDAAERLLAEWKTLRASATDVGRLFAIATLLRGCLIVRDEFELLRAVTETTLELVTDPVQRHELHAALAGCAVRAQDLEAAERWLAHCDHESDILEVDSSFRTTRAGIDLARGEFEAMLQTLGRDDTTPIHCSSYGLAAMLRAHALEHAGHPRDADHQIDRLALRPVSRGGGMAAVVVLVNANAWRGLAVAPFARWKAKVKRTGGIVRGAIVVIGAVIAYAASHRLGWAIGVPIGLALPVLVYGVALRGRARFRRFEALARRATTPGR